LHQGIDLSGADEIVLGKAVDGVRAVTHLATIITDVEIGVMVLAMRDPGHGIHEGHGVVIVLEGIGFAQLAVAQLPAVEFGQQKRDLFFR